MRSHSAFLVGSLALVALAASTATDPLPEAAPVTVRVDLVADLKAASPKPPAGHWVLRTEDQSEPIRVEIRPGVRSSVELPPGKRWEIGLEAEGFWAVRRVLAMDATPAERSVQLEVWPLGVVAGDLQLGDRRDKLPEYLEVAVLLPAERRAGGPSGRSGCDLKPKNAETVSFTCRLPATKLDLSFQPGGGFAPDYVRGVDISAVKPRILQPLILRKGGAVTGWVRTEGGSGLVPGLCFARVEPALGPAGGGPRLGLSIRSTGAEKTVGADGSFEFSALAPGVYRLRVEQTGYSPFVSGPIHVQAGVQTLLQDAAVLSAPSDLEIAISPEADPQGQPWLFTLIRTEGGGYGPAFEGASNGQGIVRAKGLEATTYLATISDALGSQYWSDWQFQVGGSGALRREIQLELWSVRGTVRRAGSPLDAVVVFGGRYGTERVRMEANEGKFSGLLARLGPWRVEVEWGDPARTATVEVEVAEVGTHRGEVEIEVPAGRAFGRVVDAAGKPAQGAEVGVAFEKGPYFHTSTDIQGLFEFEGMPEGEASFTADFGEMSDRQTSEPVVRTIAAEGPTGPIALALRRTAPWSGRVLSGYGPVAGATVDLFSTLPSPDLGATVRTDLDGRFEAQLPARVTGAIAMVRAPGYGFRGLRMPRPGGTANLSPAQGSLSVKPPADFAEHLAKREMLAIFQDGLYLHFATLESWSRMQGSPIVPFPPVFVIPGMAPGNYRACLASRDVAVLFSGLVDPGGCVEGVLEAGGVLELDMDHK